MLERALLGDAEQPGRPGPVVGTEHLDELGGGPGVELPLDPVGVGVEGGGEPALGGAELGEQEVGRLPRDALAERVPGLPPPAGVDAEQLRVVVEHLLEVRHHPAPVDRVAREAARELVVEASAGHRGHRRRGEVHGLRGPGARAVPEQELQHHRRRELRRAAETAVAGVELPRQRADRAGEHVRVERLVARRHPLAAQVLRDVPGDPAYLVPPLRPRGDQRLEDLPERRLALTWLVGVVGAGEERLALGGEHHGHRPAPVAGHRGGGRHVDRVDVGALLAVDLDVDEVLVHVRRGRLVLERLVGHHVAPVARGVAHAQQDRAVGFRRLRERLGGPLPPVHRVVGMLQEVGARRLRQPVRHLGRPPSRIQRGIHHHLHRNPARTHVSVVRRGQLAGTWLTDGSPNRSTLSTAGCLRAAGPSENSRRTLTVTCRTKRRVAAGRW